MAKKRRGNISIKIGFNFGHEDDDLKSDIPKLKKHLKANWLNLGDEFPSDPTLRDELTKAIKIFFDNVNDREKLDSFEMHYPFYHVLEDPDDE
jgi:hypothetical protein